MYTVINCRDLFTMHLVYYNLKGTINFQVIYYAEHMFLTPCIYRSSLLAGP